MNNFEFEKTNNIIEKLKSKIEYLSYKEEDMELKYLSIISLLDAMLYYSEFLLFYPKAHNFVFNEIFNFFEKNNDLLVELYNEIINIKKQKQNLKRKFKKSTNILFYYENSK